MTRYEQVKVGNNRKILEAIFIMFTITSAF